MRRALIVGAGIGGLAAGIALRNAGWDVRIFERAATPREIGFGLALAPNAMLALRHLGLAEAVRERAFSPNGARGEVRRVDGTVLKRAEFPPPEVFGGSLVVALRPALHGALLDAAGLDAITVSREAVGFSVAGERVALRFADGEVVEGDLLVGADGLGSVIRRALHPNEPAPRVSRVVAVRGAVHGQLHQLGGLAGIYYLGPGVEAFLVRASDTGIYWVLSLAEELIPPQMRDPAEVLAHMAPKFDATYRAVTSATDDLRLDELVDRDPLPFWSAGPVTLLGDAAHPLLPHTGQGAAQAIVDAVTLGRLLSADGNLAAALGAYERERIPKTSALLRQGRRTARIMRIRNPVAVATRDAVVRMLPIRTMLKLIVTINRRAGTEVAR